MASKRSQPELAYKAYIYRTIPNTFGSEIAVTTASDTEVDVLSQFSGQFVFLCASGGDVTVLRGSHTMTAGKGIFIPDGGKEEFFVDPSDDSFSLSHIGSAACTLYILHDSERV